MKNQISPRPLRALAAITALALCALTVAAQDSATSTTAPAANAPASSTALQLSFGVPDVLKLSNAKVSADTIVSYVQYSGRSYGALNAAEIVYLHEQGVSDRVVTAMLEQRKKWTETAAQPTQQAPVASAPQYQQAPAPTQVTYVQPAPASTVYVIPNTPRYVDYGYYPWYGYYGYSYPAVSLSFGYYGGYRGGYYCGSGYYGSGYHGGNVYHGGSSYHGGGHYVSGGYHSGGHYAGSGSHGGGGGGHHR